jgi:hypothetical protein
MQREQLLDCAGRRRSPDTLASCHAVHPPRNKGLRYPPNPPTGEEIIAVMSAAGNDPGLRLRGVIVVLWSAGLRISEGLSLLRPTSISRGVPAPPRVSGRSYGRHSPKAARRTLTCPRLGPSPTLGRGAAAGRQGRHQPGYQLTIAFRGVALARVRRLRRSGSDGLTA